MIVITIARKPLEGTVAANVLRHGCGGINIDASRIPPGRFPANLILSEDAAKSFDNQSGVCPSTLAGRANPTELHVNPGKSDPTVSMFGVGVGIGNVYADTGGASRFFKVVKP